MMSMFQGCDARLGSRKDEEDHVEMVLVERTVVVVVVERNLNRLSSAMTNKCGGKNIEIKLSDETMPT